MSESLFASERPGNTHRCLYQALLASVVLHLLAFKVFEISTFPIAKDRPTRQRITVLLPTAAPTEQEAPSDVPRAALEPVTVSGRRKPIRQPPAEDRSRPDPLNLSRQSLLQAIESLGPDFEQQHETSANGAVVMDPVLRGILADSERRAGSIEDTSQLSPDVNFSNGQRTDYVKIGDTCFFVRAADPTDSLSQEMWFRTPCR